ncbi:MAG: dienelactone hydrolase family protein [Gammaproteobacteria bacterium]|nr:dienelactone hydrolase family protein [Gammaproteobacteria bacterium]
MPTILESIIVEPKEAPVAAVIWLHGLGSNGHDFVPAIEALALADKHKIRFILPHAPVQPVTVNAGMMMRAWYDINSLDRELHKQDAEGIHKSYEAVSLLIDQQIAAGIPSNKIIIAGFSQGGAIALYTGLCYGYTLAGIIGLSTYLPVSEIITQQKHSSNATTPVLMIHGTHDDVIPLRDAEDSKDALLAMNCAVTWQTYTMGHSVCPQELFLIMQWLEERLLG